MERIKSYIYTKCKIESSDYTQDGYLYRVMPGDTGLEEMTVIFGHTPTIFYQPDEPPKIWHGQNLIGIDCGAAYIDGRLACLRLDDMKEYYSRC